MKDEYGREYWIITTSAESYAFYGTVKETGRQLGYENIYRGEPNIAIRQATESEEDIALIEQHSGLPGI